MSFKNENYDKNWFVNFILNSKLFAIILGSIACIFVVCCFFSFKINFFEKIISEIYQKCQTLWIQIRPDILSNLIWVQTACKGDKR